MTSRQKTARRAAYLGMLARDHGRVGNISPDEVADLTGRIVAAYQQDDDEADRLLERIAGEISDI